jgi:hypothetical protein
VSYELAAIEQSARSTHTCIALLAVLCLSISCDRDCPTQPPPPEDKGYNFYVLSRVSSITGPTVFIYNTKQMTFVDSIPRDVVGSAFDYTDIEISADEHFMILSTADFGPSKMKIIDLTMRQTVFEQTGELVDVEVSRNGRNIAVQGNIPIRHLDIRTFDTVFIDTGGGFGGKFDSTGNIFYSTRWRTDHSVIRRFDVITGTALPEVTFVDSAYPGSAVFRVQPTANPNKVFLYIYYGLNSGRVVSYNLADSSIGSSYWIGSQNTELAITSDWKTVLFTDPQNFDNWEVERSVYMVDAATDQLETIIPPPPPPYSNVPNPNPLLNPVEMAVSPDGNFAMVSNGFEYGADIGLISLKESRYLDYPKVAATLYALLLAVACRAKP